MRLAIPLDAPGPPGPVDNAFSSWPSTEGWALRFEVEVAVRGDPDPTTGYLLDIGAVDRAVRDLVLGLASRAGDRSPGSEAGADLRPVRLPPPGSILRTLLDRLPERLGSPVASVALHFAPFLHLRIQRVSTDRILLRQSFEFSASHRLHCPAYDEARNRELFGKCNNQNGHGHNYRLEANVDVALEEDGRTVPALTTIESIVRSTVIDRLDHTHLNLDVPEFRTLNPSVEHIARVCHGWLVAPLADAGGRLRSVVLWETGKTCCEYPVVPLDDRTEPGARDTLPPVLR